MVENSRMIIAVSYDIVCEGLRSVLHGGAGVAVVGQADDGPEAIELARRLRPDLAIVDTLLGGVNGTDVTCQIIAANGSTRVIGWACRPSEEGRARFFKAGGSAYIGQGCTIAELLSAIDVVRGGGRYVGGPVGDADASTPGTSQRGPRLPLTARQREILRLIAEGNSTRRIARLLKISVKTVESHRQNLMARLDLYNVAALTKYAIREGISTLDI